jgi:hypothetical protein
MGAYNSGAIQCYDRSQFSNIDSLIYHNPIFLLSVADLVHNPIFSPRGQQIAEDLEVVRSRDSWKQKGVGLDYFHFNVQHRLSIFGCDSNVVLGLLY